MKPFDLLALMPPPASGTEPNPRGQLLQMLGMFAILGVMFYFLLIRPQSKQRKQHQEMLDKLERGDEVIASGGIYGRITGLTDKVATLEIAPNVRIKVVRSTISGLASEELSADKPKDKSE